MGGGGGGGQVDFTVEYRHHYAVLQSTVTAMYFLS